MRIESEMCSADTFDSIRTDGLHKEISQKRFDSNDSTKIYFFLFFYPLTGPKINILAVVGAVFLFFVDGQNMKANQEFLLSLRSVSPSSNLHIIYAYISVVISRQALS